MRIFGREISVRKSVPQLLAPISGWWGAMCGRIAESFSGAWQQNVEIRQPTVTAYWAVFACATMIAGDVSKLDLAVRQKIGPIFVPTLQRRAVLQRPNRYQNRIEFFFSWVMSLLIHGNAYILKERDSKGFIIAMYVLDPCRVYPLITPDGGVYYQLAPDNVGNVLQPGVTVPASEIIHDKMYTMFHPLIGVSPLYACGLAAMQGSAILTNSTKFFENMSRPAGIIYVPGSLDQTKALGIKATWEAGYSGVNAGRTAVLADSMKYEAATVNAHDAQLTEQLKMTAEIICACFHVPGYKIGVGTPPNVTNIAALNQQYFDQCLQRIIENIELHLDEGLEISYPYETWFDVKALLRMDPTARYAAHKEGISGGWLKPNEVRIEEDYEPVEGGDTPYLQQQNYSLGALARRDSQTEDGTANVQAAAMNGAQVTSLQGLIVAAASGQIPPDTVRAAIAAAFPLITPEQIDAMIGPLGTPDPTPPVAPAAPAADPVPEKSATVAPAPRSNEAAAMAELAAQMKTLAAMAPLHIKTTTSRVLH